jgi:hypothetical protein
MGASASALDSGLADLGVINPPKSPANPDFLDTDAPRFNGVSGGIPALAMLTSSSGLLLDRRLSRFAALESTSRAPVMTMSSSSGALRDFLLLLDLSRPKILAAFDDISGTSSGAGEAAPWISIECRREDGLPLALVRRSLSRVDIDLETGGVLNMADMRALPADLSGFSVRSAFSDPESLDEDLSGERLADLSDLSFEDEETFLSSFRSSFRVVAGVVLHFAQDALSPLILGRSFLEDFGSGGGVNGASGAAGGGGGASSFVLLFLLFFDLSFGAMSTIATISSSSSSAGKLPGSSEDLWLFFEDELSCSASSTSLAFFLDLELFLSSFGGVGGAGGGGGGIGSGSDASGTASKVLSLSAILPPTAFRDETPFIETSSAGLDEGVVSLSIMASSRTRG